jgi:hypothetical protein
MKGREEEQAGVWINNEHLEPGEALARTHYAVLIMCCLRRWDYDLTALGRWLAAQNVSLAQQPVCVQRRLTRQWLLALLPDPVEEACRAQRA